MQRNTVEWHGRLHTLFDFVKIMLIISLTGKWHESYWKNSISAGSLNWADALNNVILLILVFCMNKKSRGNKGESF